MPSPSAARITPPLQVSEEKYSATLLKDPFGYRVRLRGTISTVAPGSVLNPFVDAVHDTLFKAGAGEVKVDITDLEFCNSSGFKSFIYWVERIRSLPEERRYRLAFLSNPARRWQRTSLLALSCYGVESILIK